MLVHQATLPNPHVSLELVSCTWERWGSCIFTLFLLVFKTQYGLQSHRRAGAWTHSLIPGHVSDSPEGVRAYALDILFVPDSTDTITAKIQTIGELIVNEVNALPDYANKRETHFVTAMSPSHLFMRLESYSFIWEFSTMRRLQWPLVRGGATFGRIDVVSRTMLRVHPCPAS